MEKAGPNRHTGEEWKWKQKAKHCTRKYLGKTHDNKTVKTMLIAIDSFEEESAEIPYAELVKDDYAEVSKKNCKFYWRKFCSW